MTYNDVTNIPIIDKTKFTVNSTDASGGVTIVFGSPLPIQNLDDVMVLVNTPTQLSGSPVMATVKSVSNNNAYVILSNQFTGTPFASSSALSGLSITAIAIRNRIG